MSRPKPVCLLILDGWGKSDGAPGDAVAAAHKPNIDALWAECPHAYIDAHGEAVGLPAGQMGNSEVGHLNIGAGRIVYQDLTRISKSIREGGFFENPVLREVMDVAARPGRSLHLIGLLSDGGVHSHIDHLKALLRMAAANGVKDAFIGAFLDGRDVPPRSALQYIEEMLAFTTDRGIGRFSVISGRYYAMDRDRRWERVERAYRALVLGEGVLTEDPLRAVRDSYAAGVDDEFVEPVIIDGSREARIKDDDAVIFFNFRPDRARELTRALTEPAFAEFDRGEAPASPHFACMTEYDATFGLPIAFPPEEIRDTLADVLAGHGLKQLHAAETEKYAHVTFFFNGGVEEPKPGEERKLVPSPKVATYDLQPEMSAYGVRDVVVDAVNSGRYDVVIANLANLDMVGHTGVLEAAVKAVEAVDECVGSVAAAVREKGGAIIVTADHGNAERMEDSDGSPFTAHTAGSVPCLLLAPSGVRLRQRGNSLADIAPTMLQLLDIPKPAAMTGTSMIESPGNSD